MAAPQPTDLRDLTLDTLAVAFGNTLRYNGVATSPAEVIEIRRVMAIIGGNNIDRLRASLCAVTVKYTYEAAGFDRAWQLFFGGTSSIAISDLPHPRGAAAELPDDLDWDEEFSGAARRIGADEHTDEIGHLMVDDPAAAERHGESAHREENDFTVSAGTDSLGVDPDSQSVSGGVTYTIEVDTADSASAGELTGSAARVRSHPIGVDGAAAILASLDAYDARRAYGTDGVEGLDSQARTELQRALAAFVDALAQRLDEAAALDEQITAAESTPRSQQADVDRACHRLTQRMRGAPRPVITRADRGPLDIRRTMRAAVATDGVPLQLWRRVRRPGPVRLLLLLDVSLSVRPVAGFLLRLAQTLHRMGDHCEVIAFVDSPVLVTEALRTSHDPDAALTAVLAADGLDLAATSDYGTMFSGVLDLYGDLVGPRTSVLVVGDARSNGFDPRVDLLAELARRAHRLAWVTPEPRRYWHQTGCALADYIEFCDGFVSARDGAELAERADELGSALA